MPDKDGDRTPVQLLRLNGLERLEQQVKILCGISSTCEQVLAVSEDEDSTLEIDEKVTGCAIETYVAAHMQLRNIIDDSARWGATDPTDCSTEDLVKGNARIQEKQMEALRQSQMPHRKLNCQLKLFQTGWIAWMGGEFPSSSLLHGIGSSPEEALNNFDINYIQRLKQTEDHLREKPPEPPKQTPKNKPKGKPKDSPNSSK